MVAPAAKRESVAHLKALFGLPERRTCRIAGADRKMVHCKSRRAPDTALRRRFRDLDETLFHYLTHACELMAAWVTDYDTVRPTDPLHAMKVPRAGRLLNRPHLA